jgi:hypothetical protein
LGRLVVEDRIEKAPVLDVIKRQPGQIILAALARMDQMASIYIYLAFVFAGVTCHAPSRRWTRRQTFGK